MAVSFRISLLSALLMVMLLGACATMPSHEPDAAGDRVSLVSPHWRVLHIPAIVELYDVSILTFLDLIDGELSLKRFDSAHDSPMYRKRP